MNQLQTDLRDLRAWITAERAKADAATAGPWRVEARYTEDRSAACISAGINRYGDGPESYPIGSLRKGALSGDDAAFIASARASNPLALDMWKLALDGLECEYASSHQADAIFGNEGSASTRRLLTTLQSMISAWKEATNL